MKSENFKDIVTDRSGWAGLLLALAQNFLGKQTYVDDADDATLFVHDWKSEKFVEHEEFAGVENRRAGRNCDDTSNHDVAQKAIERGGEQTTCWQDPNKTFVGIDHEKIDNTL